MKAHGCVDSCSWTHGRTGDDFARDKDDRGTTFNPTACDFMAIRPCFTRASMILHGSTSPRSSRGSRASWTSPPHVLASGHVSPEHPCARMSSEKAKDDPGATLEGDTKTVVDAPASNARLKTSLSVVELHAFLARPATQAHIRKVVVARLNRTAPGTLIEDLVQDANLDASEAQSRPRSIETA